MYPSIPWLATRPLYKSILFLPAAFCYSTLTAYTGEGEREPLERERERERALRLKREINCSIANPVVEPE
jgi:hypothetical protein